MKEAPSGIEPLIAVLQTAPLATCVRRVLLKSAPCAMRFTPKRKGPPPWSERFVQTSMLIQRAERWEIRNGYYHGDVALLHLPCSLSACASSVVLVLEPSVRRLIIIHCKLAGPGAIVTRPSSPFIESRALVGRCRQGDDRSAGERRYTGGRARNATRIAGHYAFTRPGCVHRQGH